MKILVIKTNLPIKPDEAGSPRAYCLMRELAKKGHKIHLLVFTQEELPAQKINSIESDKIFSSVKVIKIPECQPSFLSKWMHRVLNLTPYDLSIKQKDILKNSQVISNTIYDENECDIALGFYISSHQFINTTKSNSIDLCDSISLLSLRKVKNIFQSKTSLLTFREALSYKKLEKKIASTFSSVLFVSQIDANWFRKITKHNNSMVVPLGVDMDYFAPDTKNQQANSLIFTGVLDYEPNKEAAEYAAYKIFPLIKAKNEQAKLNIVGRYSGKVFSEGSSPTHGINFNLNVPDIRSYLHSAQVYLSPLKTGAGVKNKILTAMACKIAIVATPISIEGMNLIHGTHCLIGRNAKELAEHSLLLLKDEKLRMKLINHAFELVQKSSWEDSANILEGILKKEVERFNSDWQ